MSDKQEIHSELIDCLIPEWPAPRHVRACTTLRTGGKSSAPYDEFNLADHVGDDPVAVQTNRAILKRCLNLPAEPAWLQQVHGIKVVNAQEIGKAVQADGSYVCHIEGKANKTVCVVLTADCLPILLSDIRGTRIAAVHAGWRGLASGVLESAIVALDCPPSDILAWFGPAIGPDAFEVGDEVREQFLQNNPDAIRAFRPTSPGHWLADIYELGRIRLAAQGVNQVYGGGLCTYADADQFYSYRRDNKTGRMASLIWFDHEEVSE